VDNHPPCITCPCCGYKTITDEYDICALCNWEHDCFQVKYPDATGANGHVTLREAQHNFMSFGACDRSAIQSVRASGPNDERDPDWKPLPPLAEGAEPVTPRTDLKTKGIYCACCGYKTVMKTHDLCAVCLWQHEPEQEADPDSLPPTHRDESNSETKDAVHTDNDVTLREAQQNYVAFGKCSFRYRGIPAVDASTYERDADWRPLPPLSPSSNR
jgi:Cysteine-rich CPCC